MSFGVLWFGEAENAKLEVLIDELAELFKVDKEIVIKGVEVIEKEAEKIHLQDKN